MVWLTAAAAVGALFYASASWLVPQGTCVRAHIEQVQSHMWVVPRGDWTNQPPLFIEAAAVTAVVRHQDGRGRPYEIALSNGEAVAGPADHELLVLQIADPWASKRTDCTAIAAENSDALYALLSAVAQSIPWDSRHGVTEASSTAVRHVLQARGELTAEESEAVLGSPEARNWLPINHLDETAVRAQSLGLLRRRLRRTRPMTITEAGHVWLEQQTLTRELDADVVEYPDEEVGIIPGIIEPGPQVDPRKVAIAHGRDGDARDAVFQFLRTLGLQPLEWEALVATTRTAAPYSGEAVQRGFSTAQAVIVLFTPDDIVQLHPDLGQGPAVLQARPNVLLETGMALATHAERTLLVAIGNVVIPTNLAGRNLIRIDGTPEPLHKIATRLESAGCRVDRPGTDWMDTTAFSALGALRRTE